MNVDKADLSCAICQPHYLPWLGYFEMIDRVDLFVFLDDVQFSKNGWQNRNRIRKTSNSNDLKWLTIPITKEKLDTLLLTKSISQKTDWITTNLAHLRESYKYSPYFNHYFSIIEKVYTENKNNPLADFNISLIKKLCEIFRIKTNFLRSSKMNLQGKREQRLVNICKHISAHHYLANNATGSYVNAEYFKQYNIIFELQNYQHPSYEQYYKNSILKFIPYLSIIDLLFNHGEDSIEIIRQGNPNRTG